MLVARDRLFVSCVGESERSFLDLVERSVWGILGSMFSFLLGVEGRGGDILRIGDPNRVGEVALVGDALLAGEAAR